MAVQGLQVTDRLVKMAVRCVQMEDPVMKVVPVLTVQGHLAQMGKGPNMVTDHVLMALGRRAQTDNGLSMVTGHHVQMGKGLSMVIGRRAQMGKDHMVIDLHVQMGKDHMVIDLRAQMGKGHMVIDLVLMERAHHMGSVLAAQVEHVPQCKVADLHLAAEEAQLQVEPVARRLQVVDPTPKKANQLRTIESPNGAVALKLAQLKKIKTNAKITTKAKAAKVGKTVGQSPL